MTFSRYRFLVRSDLHRVAGRGGVAGFVNRLRWDAGFNYCFWLRTTAFLESKRSMFGLLIARWARGVLYRKSIRFGIEIPARTSIGPGLYIGHFGGIVVCPDAAIGRNCNLSQGVTIGIANRGARKGVPVVRDGVYLAPGAKVIGAVTIGSNVAVGANAVVTDDLPDDAVAAGVPARIISMDGAGGYVNRVDYPPMGNGE